ncbi:DUF6891 domain-containing protein [Leucobacter luti]|uniref:DUF6891 domain-containing protein n=1 Tax=Leucobacter luti TaxID=340320 RepID=UPI001C69151B|nr:hypothetical protein [Leucobacter luti]QYM76559.1 hypothetical protein K1X41_03760 [Leucobacter luti]
MTEQAAAPVSTLAPAFAALGEIGVLAREAFPCCGSCGDAEIGAARDDSRVWRGYLFFDTQDAGNIAWDGDTHVSYGAFLDAYVTGDEWESLPEAAQESRYAEFVTALLLDEVFPVLERHGVTVTWNRDLATRVLLSGVALLEP